MVINQFLSNLEKFQQSLSKKNTEQNVNDLLDNIYLEKTVKHLFNKLEPKFKKIEHKVSSGETIKTRNIKFVYFLKKLEIFFLFILKVSILLTF